MLLKKMILLVVAVLLAVSSPQIAVSDDNARIGTPTANSHSNKIAAPTGEIRYAILMLNDQALRIRYCAMLEGASLTDARNAYVDRLIKLLDQNGDGQLTPDEANRSPLLATKVRPKAQAFLDTLGPSKPLTRAAVAQSVERVGGSVVAYRQDVTTGTGDREVFDFLDADGSGVIETAEMRRAAARIAERDEDRDECVSFREFLQSAEEMDMMQANAFNVTVDEPNRPKPSRSDLLWDEARSLLLIPALMRKYDKNRDRGLSADELGWTPADIKSLDTNKDNKLDSTEIALFKKLPPQMDLAVQLDGGDGSRPALQVLSSVVDVDTTVNRPDYARLVFPAAVVTVSIRKIDPISAAIANAMQQFNLLDGDGNGYLDEQETGQRVRFQRRLFAAIDTDEDGKIFGEEMERYVRFRGEPAATSCRVNVYDMGFGFFQAFDSNADGRISIRELRLAERSLSKLDRDAQSGLYPTEPSRHFHIEFVRGSYQMFGSTSQMVSQTPTFEERIPVGPVWFQRMDRNNDGDLTWNEFFGPREVFHHLDADNDELIDHQEAALADSQSSDSQPSGGGRFAPSSQTTMK